MNTSDFLAWSWLLYLIFHPFLVIFVLVLFYFKNLFLWLRVTEVRDVLEKQKEAMNKINQTLEAINRSIEKWNLIQAMNTNNIKEKDENLKVYVK